MKYKLHCLLDAGLPPSVKDYFCIPHMPLSFSFFYCTFNNWTHDVSTEFRVHLLFRRKPILYCKQPRTASYNAWHIVEKLLILFQKRFQSYVGAGGYSRAIRKSICVSICYSLWLFILFSSGSLHNSWHDQVVILSISNLELFFILLARFLHTAQHSPRFNAKGNPNMVSTAHEAIVFVSAFHHIFVENLAFLALLTGMKINFVFAALTSGRPEELV